MHLIENIVEFFISSNEPLDQILNMNQGDNNRIPESNNANATLSRDFALIVGATGTIMKMSPAGSIKKGVIGAVTFISVGSLYTVNRILSNPEGVNQTRKFARQIITDGERGRGTGQSSISNLSGDSNGFDFLGIFSAEPVPEGHDLIFMQYNALASTLFVLSLLIPVFLVICSFNCLTYYYRNKLSQYFTNKWFLGYLKFQYFLLKSNLVITAILILLIYGHIIYGLHFMVSHPLKEF